MILLIVLIIVIALLIYSTTNIVDYFQPDNITIENDIAITTLVNEGIGERAQHAAIYILNDDTFYIYVKLLTNKNSIIVLDNTYSIVDQFDDHSGACIQIVDNYLYTSGPGAIYRYEIDPQTGLVYDKINPKLTLRGVQFLPVFTIDSSTKNMYVHIPSKTNSCQSQNNDRKPGFQGEMPCTRLLLTGGVWKFDSTKINQTIDMGILYSSGLRKMSSLVLYKNYLYGIIQGRDSLYELYPDLYTKEQGEELASDELIQINQNTNFGFPYCYWDSEENKRKLSPEYGGNGKIDGHCNSLIEKPKAIFNRHNGPNDLLINNNKLYIAWNGKPKPLKCDKSCSTLSVTFFDISNSGDEMTLGEYDTLVQFDTLHKTKPSGLVYTPDNSIIIIDSLKGKIWKSTLKN
jgi:hypothetical protein